MPKSGSEHHGDTRLLRGKDWGRQERHRWTHDTNVALQLNDFHAKAQMDPRHITSPMLRSSSTIVTVAFCAKERVSTNKALTRSGDTHIYSEGRIGGAKRLQQHIKSETDGPTLPMLRSSSTIVIVAFCAKERVSANKALSFAKGTTVTHVYSGGRIGERAPRTKVRGTDHVTNVALQQSGPAPTRR